MDGLELISFLESVNCCYLNILVRYAADGKLFLQMFVCRFPPGCTQSDWESVRQDYNHPQSRNRRGRGLEGFDAALPLSNKSRAADRSGTNPNI
jgi:hypothetical protein